MDPMLEILKQRLAKGEIDQQAYDRIAAEIARADSSRERTPPLGHAATAPVPAKPNVGSQELALNSNFMNGPMLLVIVGCSLLFVTLVGVLFVVAISFFAAASQKPTESFAASKNDPPKTEYSSTVEATPQETTPPVYQPPSPPRQPEPEPIPAVVTKTLAYLSQVEPILNSGHNPPPGAAMPRHYEQIASDVIGESRSGVDPTVASACYDEALNYRVLAVHVTLQQDRSNGGGFANLLSGSLALAAMAERDELHAKREDAVAVFRRKYDLQ